MPERPNNRNSPLLESLAIRDLLNREYRINSISKYDVLIVYNNELDIKNYDRVLQSIFNIRTAKDLGEVQNILNSFNNINLIIIDHPDCYNILRFIKTNQVYCEVPTVLIEGFRATNSLRLAIENGAYDVWHKPMNRDLLLYRATSIAKRTSIIDLKTGLFSQDAFLARAENILKKNKTKTYYLIHYDIDNFKIYNHTYGVQDGDELLRFIGQNSLSFVTEDSIFCRWEKDHFVALIEEHYLSSKKVIKFFMGLEQKFHPEYKLLIRMGLYKIEDDKLSIIQMCDRALLAHEASKEDSQTRYAFYDERLLKNRVEEQEITDEMESALENGEFVVYLQPQYNQSNMHLYGAEALVRWMHPKRGLISPGFFIPIFEKNGFILKLDRYVFRKVCELQRNWLDNGLKVVPISVNLSRLEAQNDNLYKELLEILDEYHLSTNYVNLEITESAYMDNPYQVISLTKKLQEAGFELEMDDFGSGYSSLNTLKDIPVNVLKLDFKFLYGEDDSDRITKILSSIIRMAHGMNMPIIAEGVETEEQADYLKSMGCFYIQGFYFDKPLTASDFENRLLDYEKDHFNNSRFVEGNNSIEVSSLLNEVVGPAAIIEYDGKNIEGCRFNDAFFNLFNITDISFDVSQYIINTVFDKENYNIFKSAIDKAIETREEEVCEVQLLSSKNKIIPRWVRISIRFLFSTEHICTLHTKLENIEEEKAKDEQIKKLKEDAYALSESLPGGIITFNFINRKVFVDNANEQMAFMVGYSLNEFLSKMQKDSVAVIAQEDKQKVRNTFKSLFSEKFPNFIEIDFKLDHKDGSVVNAKLFTKLNIRPDGSKFAVAIVLNFTDNEDFQNKVTNVKEKLKKIESFDLGNIDDLLFNKECLGFDFYNNALRFGIFKYDYYNDKITAMSPSVYKMFGYTREEFYNKFNDSLGKLIWKEDIQDLQKIMGQDRDPYRQDLFVTHRVQTKDGKLKWIKGFGKKIYTTNGEENCFGIMIDIDPYKQVEEKLTTQNFLISSFENNLEGAMIRFKIKGKKWSVDYFSENIITMLGYKKEELIQKWQDNVFAFVHPEDLNRVKNEFSFSLEDKQTATNLVKLIKSDGSIIWIKTKGTFYGQSNDGYYVTTCYDLTQQVEKENLLLQEKQRLQKLIDALPGGMALYEIRHDVLKVLYVTPKVCEMFGRTKEEFIKAVEENSDLSVLSQDSEKVQKAIKNLEKTGQSFNIDFRVKHLKDNSIVWVNVSAVKTSENNGNPIFVAIYQDKTKNTNTLDKILSKTSFYVVVFDTLTKDLLYANNQAQNLSNKTFDAFNPINISEFIYDKRIEDLDKAIPDSFSEDSYKTVHRGKNLFIQRFRVDWNGHDCIFVLAEEII